MLSETELNHLGDEEVRALVLNYFAEIFHENTFHRVLFLFFLLQRLRLVNPLWKNFARIQRCMAFGIWPNENAIGLKGHRIYSTFFPYSFGKRIFFSIKCSNHFSFENKQCVLHFKIIRQMYRIWWTIAFALSVCMCIIAIFSLWHKWHRRPVIMSFNDKSTPIGTIPFPGNKIKFISFGSSIKKLMFLIRIQ